MTRLFLAIDLGAESGRAVLSRLERGRLTVDEIHRFPTPSLVLNGRLHWDAYALLSEIKTALRTCAAGGAAGVESLAVDAWGVDFGLLSGDGTLLGLPVSYRDTRIRGAMEAFLRIVGRERIYEETGIQFLSFNSLFQLYSLVRDGSPLLGATARLLFMPDLFNFFLTGRQATEYTIASTSQLLDMRTGRWRDDLLAALGLAPGILADPVAPGTILGPLLPPLASEAALGPVRVVATASHDTAAAVAAVPATDEDCVYISSGTWSCLGTELSAPVISAASLAHNFTNEGGVEGTIRFLKNIMGLWLVQGCRRSWAKRVSYGYPELTALAEAAPSFGAVIDPDADDFLNPPDMPDAINGYLRRTAQAPLDAPGAFIRTILESLALKYRYVIEEIVRIVGRAVSRVHIIGGGSRNDLLNQLTADATGRPVVAGPAEATSIGNILVQLKAARAVSGLPEMRALVAASFPPRTFAPRPSPAWEDAYRRFLGLPGLSAPGAVGGRT
jgi:rhamnulokinase